MHRFLNILLILSVLVTQSAWAIQGTEFDLTDSNDSAGQIHSLPADQHDEASNDCNHFCHASGHFVGLFSNNTIDLLSSNNSYDFTFKNLVTSLNYQPLIPPPIS